MAKRKKKSERKLLKDNCMELAKKIAKARDKNICQYCKKHVNGSDSQGSHVIPVARDGRLAIDSKNIKVLCFGCHLQGWHLHPVEYGSWFKRTFKARWKYLDNEHKKNQSLGTIGISWYRERYKELKEEYKAIS